MSMNMEPLKLIPGYRTALADGRLVPDSPKHMATEAFYKALPGSRIRLCNREYLFAVAVFSTVRNPGYIYSYDYEPEENWTTYTRNLTPESYGQEDYVFQEKCWFRVCVKRRDNADLTEADFRHREELAVFCHEPETYTELPCFTQEIEDTIAKIRREEAGCMKLCLLTDTHYTVNGTWEDTAHNIRRVSEKAGYDAIIHLGDLTDGMVSKDMTAEYVRRIIGDLEACGAPVYLTPGNHDSNYFRNRQNLFSGEEMKRLYRLYGDKEADGENGLDYCVDVPAYAVRMVFLASFDDTSSIRYGYTEEQLRWLEEVLFHADAGTKFLIFSHDAPLAKLDYWSFYIRNGERLLDLLERCNAREEYQILGFFYGHIHADQIFEECSFPVISVGCAKLEYFLDKKPEGAVTYERKADTVTQDLWDSLLIDFRRQRLKLIRFGAGVDREVSFARQKSTYKEAAVRARAGRSMKLWAHRGASGHAPENTMPAFELAQMLGADGIELDVQLTKDGVPVVIHDERVDRVSDGSGEVKDYTLEELKTLNMNRSFPSYGKVLIPTLEEVCDFVKGTDMLINLELKNSVVFYEGLEEKVLALAEQKGMADRIIYSSFNHFSMQRILRLQPSARVAFLYTDGILDIAEYAAKYGAYAVHPSLKNMEYADVVGSCHERGIRVHVWTVNERADFERMQRLGVDAVITNYIEKG